MRHSKNTKRTGQRSIIIYFLFFYFLVAFDSGPCAAYDDQWTTLAAPQRSGMTLNLRRIWGTSEENAYSAGFFFDENGVSLRIPIIIHYDGNNVEEMILPDNYGISLYGIWGTSNSNIYAVGAVNPSPDVFTDPYMLHYDGTSWSEVTSLPSIGDAKLYCVWGTSDDDIFVGGGQEGVILHYDGTAWSTMTLPAMSPIPDIWKIWGTSSTDVWAVGRQYDANANPQNVGIWLHYDGTAWTLRYTLDDSLMSGIWGDSSTNVFFCGYRYRADDKDIPIVARYDGNSISWKEVQISEDYLGRARGRLREVWGSSGNDVYATGAWCLLHYNGNSSNDWTQQLNARGLTGWAYNSIHNFKGGWDFSKYGRNVQSTSGTKIKVATSQGEFDFVLPVNPATIVDDRNRPSSLPYGLFDYSIPVPQYDLVRITFQFPGELDSSFKWFKYDPDSGWYQYNRAYFDTVTDDFGEKHTIVRIYIEDNGDGDSDSRPGWINDPSGPGNTGTGGGGGAGGGGGCFLSTSNPK